MQSDFSRVTNLFIFDSTNLLDKLLSTTLVLLFLSVAIVVPYLFVLSLGSVLPIGSTAIGLEPWFKLSVRYVHPAFYKPWEVVLGVTTFVILLLNFAYCFKFSLSCGRIIWKKH